MKKLIILLVCLILAVSIAYADYLGSWPIDANIVITANVHSPITGGTIVPDAAPIYTVYEDVNEVNLLTGPMIAFDTGHTTGLYKKQIALTAANGFEAGKFYSVDINAIVGGVSGTKTDVFQIDLNNATLKVAIDTNHIPRDADGVVNANMKYADGNTIPTIEDVGTGVAGKVLKDPNNLIAVDADGYVIDANGTAILAAIAAADTNDPNKIFTADDRKMLQDANDHAKKAEEYSKKRRGK